MLAGAPPASPPAASPLPPPPPAAPAAVPDWVLEVAVPAACAALVGLFVLCVCTRRWRRRRRIAMLWQQHIQDTVGGYGSSDTTAFIA
jgi:hypothetical protein